MRGPFGQATILYVHSSADLYGSDRCLFDLVTRLDRQRFRPIVILPYKGLLSEDMEKEGIRIIHQDPWVLRKALIRTGGFRRYLMSLPSCVGEIMRIIKKEKVSLVHSNTGVVLGGALAAGLCRCPHVWHLREFFSDYPTLWPAFAAAMGILSRKILCISEAVASQIPAFVGRKSVVVHDGIQAPRDDLRGGSEVLRRELGLDHGMRVVGTIGRVSEIKAQDVFIRAVPEVLSSLPRTRFLIVGDVFPGHEPYMERLKGLVETLGIGSHVVFTGFHRDVSDLVRLMDIVVLTTRIPEGLGISLLEAMAAGKAVIATRGGGSGEVVTDGVTGLLVPPGDFRSLGRAVVGLLSSDSLREKMGQEGKRRAAEKFSIHETVSAVHNIYEEVLR